MKKSIPILSFVLLTLLACADAGPISKGFWGDYIEVITIISIFAVPIGAAYGAITYPMISLSPDKLARFAWIWKLMLGLSAIGIIMALFAWIFKQWLLVILGSSLFSGLMSMVIYSQVARLIFYQFDQAGYARGAISGAIWGVLVGLSVGLTGGPGPALFFTCIGAIGCAIGGMLFERFGIRVAQAIEEGSWW